jgi:pimeloyl-ACP methyl ester carboxylesterase
MALYLARMPEIDITENLAAIRVPTLVITGDCDPIVPPAQAFLIADRVRDANLVVIPGAGHMPHLSYFDVYGDWVKAWLRERQFAARDDQPSTPNS